LARYRRRKFDSEAHKGIYTSPLPRAGPYAEPRYHAEPVDRSTSPWRPPEANYELRLERPDDGKLDLEALLERMDGEFVEQVKEIGRRLVEAEYEEIKELEEARQREGQLGIEREIVSLDDLPDSWFERRKRQHPSPFYDG